MHRKRVVLIWLAVQLAGFSAAANAYLDPGTGSILVQSLLAGIVELELASVRLAKRRSFFPGADPAFPDCAALLPESGGGTRSDAFYPGEPDFSRRLLRRRNQRLSVCGPESRDRVAGGRSR